MVVTSDAIRFVSLRPGGTCYIIVLQCVSFCQCIDIIVCVDRCVEDINNRSPL